MGMFRTTRRVLDSDLYLPHQTDSEAAILKEWWVVQDNSALGLALAGHHRSDVVSLRETALLNKSNFC
ncbi:hypothetical protein AS657_05690 [Serratia marcescens]|nr:hypothetical protein AS657_05690 [Serratia marcescens]